MRMGRYCEIITIVSCFSGCIGYGLIKISCNYFNKMGKTPLYYAVKNNFVNICKVHFINYCYYINKLLFYHGTSPWS